MGVELGLFLMWFELHVQQYLRQVKVDLVYILKVVTELSVLLLRSQLINSVKD